MLSKVTVKSSVFSTAKKTRSVLTILLAFCLNSRGHLKGNTARSCSQSAPSFHSTVFISSYSYAHRRTALAVIVTCCIYYDDHGRHPGASVDTPGGECHRYVMSGEAADEVNRSSRSCQGGVKKV